MGGFPARHEPAVTATRPSNASSPVSIRQEDLIQSVADALQYISYYHPADYIRTLAAAQSARNRRRPRTPWRRS